MPAGSGHADNTDKPNSQRLPTGPPQCAHKRQAITEFHPVPKRLDTNNCNSWSVTPRRRMADPELEGRASAKVFIPERGSSSKLKPQLVTTAECSSLGPGTYLQVTNYCQLQKS